MSAPEDYSTASYYHYTDEAGARAIQQEGYINPSRNGRDGPGSYVTEIRPSAGQEKILFNNYSVPKVRANSKKKVSYAVRIPKESSPDIVPVKTSTRNIHRCPTGINVGQNPEIIEVQKKNKYRK